MLFGIVCISPPVYKKQCCITFTRIFVSNITPWLLIFTVHLSVAFLFCGCWVQAYHSPIEVASENNAGNFFIQADNYMRQFRYVNSVYEIGCSKRLTYFNKAIIVA
ncbi:hypothetical protein ABIC84_001433 [Mucilaginibacter sp. 3215]